jgi:emericellamide synthase (highly reducing iterative type I polyketide synthase)
MADHGAKHILAISRSGAKEEQDQNFIGELAKKGVKVHAKKCDVSSESAVISLVQETGGEEIPPIRGVVQSAMLLKVRVVCPFPVRREAEEMR